MAGYGAHATNRTLSGKGTVQSSRVWRLSGALSFCLLVSSQQTLSDGGFFAVVLTADSKRVPRDAFVRNTTNTDGSV